MDLYRAIKELEQEKKRLDGVINSLEALYAEETKLAVASKKPPPGRRGRKEMTPAERLEVSDRMRKYWETRRATPHP
jgi:hypothetical protein